MGPLKKRKPLVVAKAEAGGQHTLTQCREREAYFRRLLHDTRAFAAYLNKPS